MRYLLCLLIAIFMLSGCTHSLHSLGQDWKIPYLSDLTAQTPYSDDNKKAPRSKPSKKSESDIKTPEKVMKTSLSDPIMADQF